MSTNALQEIRHINKLASKIPVPSSNTDSSFEVDPLVENQALKLLFRLTGWPRPRENRENREFGSYFFQTGKTQGILL